jgi:hypothetical protein
MNQLGGGETKFPNALIVNVHLTDHTCLQPIAAKLTDSKHNTATHYFSFHFLFSTDRFIHSFMTLFCVFVNNDPASDR